MLRLPNPSSDIQSFIRIFRILYEELGPVPTFTLDDMSRVLVERNMASSSGHIGAKALELSTRDDRGRDPLFNQSKMYSELFRILGWMRPQQDNRLICSMTYLGTHVAEAVQPAALFKECVLGIAYPNSAVEAKGNHKLRPFSCVLRAMAELGGMICRDEMILGPLSVNTDRELQTFNRMAEGIKALRGSKSRLDKALQNAAQKHGVKINTMRNYTRFPIGVLEWCGWAVKERRKDVYGRSLVFQVLTPEGRERANWLDQATDVRAADLATLSEPTKNAIIRTTFYQLLGRAGFDTEPVRTQLQTDLAVIAKDMDAVALLGKAKQMLISPFQELDSRTLQSCFPRLERSSQKQPAPTAQPKTFTPGRLTGPAIDKVQSQVVLAQPSTTAAAFQPKNNAAQEILKAYKQFGGRTTDMVEALANKHARANRDTFYPLVAHLFQAIGSNCEITRAGVNYQRWDALILDEKESIPIEIKSPGEEQFISVKAVRQALENKVILLARKPFPTLPRTTSLVVGYNLPNDRSEVASLIQDINKTYEVNIGVLDFRALLRLAIAAECEGRTPSPHDLVHLNGLIEISYAEANRANCAEQAPTPRPPA